MTNKYRYFFKLNFVRVDRLFVFFHPNRDNDVKKFKAQRHYLPKGVIKKYNIIINGKNFFD